MHDKPVQVAARVFFCHRLWFSQGSRGQNSERRGINTNKYKYKYKQQSRGKIWMTSTPAANVTIPPLLLLFELGNSWNCLALYGASKDSAWPKMWSKEIKSMAFAWLVKLWWRTMCWTKCPNCPPGHSHVARLTSWKPHLPNNFANWAPQQLPNYNCQIITSFYDRLDIWHLSYENVKVMVWCETRNVSQQATP